MKEKTLKIIIAVLAVLLIAGVTAYALCLRDSEYKANATPQMALELVSSSVGTDKGGFRKQFAELIKKCYKL